MSIRSSIATHRIVWISLAVWIPVLTVTIVASLQKESAGWTVAKELLAPISGSLGAVVVGAIGVDYWRHLDQASADRRVVTRVKRFIHGEYEEVRGLLAECAVAAYSIARPLLDAENQIPRALIVERLTWPESLNSNVNSKYFGPHAWASHQAAALANFSSSTQDPHKASLAPRGDGEAESVARLKALASHLPGLSDSVAELVGDLGVLETYRPIRDRISLDDNTIVELLSHLHALTARSRVVSVIASEITTDPNGRVVPDERDRFAEALRAVHGILSAVVAINAIIRVYLTELANGSFTEGHYRRGVLGQIDRNLDFLSDLARTGAAPSDGDRRAHAANWENFKRTAKVNFD